METEYRKPWVQRHWVLMLVLSFVVMMALSLAVGLGSLYALMSSVEDTAPYREAMARVRGDAGMVQALGEPIRTKWIPLGVVEQRDQGRAAFGVFLRGPRGEGSVDVQGEFESGTWHYQRLQGEAFGPPRERFDLRGAADR